MVDGVILVAGTPGTGKSTVGRLLAGLLDSSFYSTSRLALELGVARPDPTGRLTYVLDEDGVRSIIGRIGREEGYVVLETVTPKLFLDSTLGPDIVVVFLLRTNPRELCERLKRSRPEWPKQKVFENCAAEAFNTIAEELLDYWHSVVEVDTTGKSPLESADEALERLVEWRVGVEIDWLERDPSLVEDVSRWLSGVDFDKYRFGY